MKTKVNAASHASGEKGEVMAVKSESAGKTGVEGHLHESNCII